MVNRKRVYRNMAVKLIHTLTLFLLAVNFVKEIKRCILISIQPLR